MVRRQGALVPGERLLSIFKLERSFAKEHGPHEELGARRDASGLLPRDFVAPIPL